ncbi:hypothetical protein [Flavihumibacter fluvii]|uniref:hypothetical protein n=1 Tax=Flavihumibacter fluvii TaxID=2838157 RepID=UPI001BDEA543|nr:hypothetical protein [Flavihumibacter fluvii]ULQ53466.1 hypothetical protein KJS93_03920 [Flavihumibacter fluvii]
MQTPHNIDFQLWEYIDGLGSADERSVIAELIATNQEWRRKYEELIHFNASLSENIDLDSPSMRFTRNVMEEIARYQIAPSAKSYINKKIIYGIAGFFLTLIAGFLIYAIGQIDWTVGSGTSALPIDFTKINFSKAFSNNYINAFMIINSVLGLMLLDRYLAQERKSWKKQEG